MRNSYSQTRMIATGIMSVSEGRHAEECPAMWCTDKAFYHRMIYCGKLERQQTVQA